MKQLHTFYQNKKAGTHHYFNKSDDEVMTSETLTAIPMKPSVKGIAISCGSTSAKKVVCPVKLNLKK
jgi:hypothetical protein